ncbi:phage tail protein, partial [Escherichia coli]|nr:phage tail protein [Escherichia coli]
ALALKAPLASPAFTGTPTAPTASQGTNSTQIANTAFVKAAITALINGAPGTLDTLKEIAAAINNDPNFSTTINNALALKAPLASPAL